MKRVLFPILLLIVWLNTATSFGKPYKDGDNIDSLFLNPPSEAKPIMIWQWMDGLVTREGITKDLEAYKEAGIGGVQNFQIGGPLQGLIADTANAVGTDNWKGLMAYAINECARLGISYGTHNCPGWSSSGYPSVKPEDSMQKLVWTETRVTGRWQGVLPQPGVDPKYNYYEDIAMLAIPDKAIADTVIFLGTKPYVNWTANKGNWILLRIGHTTNGKTNCNNAPYGGVGLEVDKMSKEKVDKFWQTYPAMLLKLAGNNVGKTFCRLEIDSYEAGAQDWTPLMAEEFQKRCGYSLTKWLPVLTGHTVESKEATERFLKQWKEVIAQLFAENYYGEMNRLARKAGLQLLIQPYGDPLDPMLCTKAAPGSLLCGEFWTHPDNWGGHSIEKMSAIAWQTGYRELYAEGMTCWPLYAWKSDPASLKASADVSFLKGVNHLMLHAAASNPWTKVQPGMSFGKWGTQFQPGQTWWKTGAKPFFRYISRCQSLLQKGDFYRQDSCRNGLRYIWRKTANEDIIFVANVTDRDMTDTLTLAIKPTTAEARCSAELWYPDNGERTKAKLTDNGDIYLELEGHGSVFVILRKDSRPLVAYKPRLKNVSSNTPFMKIGKTWRVTFCEPGRTSGEWIVKSDNDTLPSWTTSDDKNIKYFSGTATYSTTVELDKLPRKSPDGTDMTICLDLGKVKNIAVVRVNGIVCDTLWKAPFIADVSKALHKGKNKIEVDVVNLWPNRMTGDEFEPDDMEWGDEIHYEYAPGNPPIGRFLKSVPQWLKEGRPRPSRDRRTVTCFKFFTKDSPLLESGLIGPVSLYATCTN